MVVGSVAGGSFRTANLTLERSAAQITSERANVGFGVLQLQDSATVSWLLQLNGAFEEDNQVLAGKIIEY